MTHALAHRPRVRALALAVAALLGAAAATAQPAPQANGPADAGNRWVWDLRPLFRSDEAWDGERRALEADLGQLAPLRGTLGRSAASLRDALDLVSRLSQRMDRLWIYASTQQSTDNRDARNQERTGLMQSLWGRYGSARAWMDPEIQALGRTQVEAFIAAEPGLARHAFGLRETLRQAEHTLGAEAEDVLAAVAPVMSAPGQTRTLLVSSDIEWPVLTVDGKPQRVDDTGYEGLRQHADRTLRKQAMDSFFGTLGKYESTFGSTLAARVRAGVIEARLRKYPTAVAARLSEVGVPETVYRTLVAEANRSLPTLHRYFKLRQRLLQLPDLHYYDIYPPLVKSDATYPPEEAARLTLAAVAPLGPDYVKRLSDVLALRTMHVMPAVGKSGGAYQTGAYGLPPFVFLNHRNDWGSVSTFAHEWGHGMHTVLADSAQPYETRHYPTFTAEIASVTNEVLLTEYAAKQARTRDEKLFILGHALENLRATYYRQTMFGEFELQAHDALEKGEALSGKKFTALYCGLLRKYHGADSGVMAIDPLYCQEWAFIPHFYRPFYVYQYATSAAAATYFAEQILSGKPGARDTYLNVLRAGGSDSPYELLKRAGLDMASPAPYQALARRMDALMDEMEALLAAR